MAETLDKPLKPKGKKQAVENRPYTFRPPALWADAWNAGAVLAAELEADVGFVADCISSDGETIVAADGMTVGVYAASNGERTHTLEGHTDKVCSVVCQGDLIVSGSRDLTTGCGLITGRALGLSWAALNSCLAWLCKGIIFRWRGARRQNAHLWSIQTAQMLETFEEHTGSIWSVALGNQIAVTASRDCTARVWSSGEARVLPALEYFAIGLGILCSLDNEIVATGCRDGYVRLWSIATHTCLRTFEHGANHQAILPSIYSVRLVSRILLTAVMINEYDLVRPFNDDNAMLVSLDHGASGRGITISPTGHGRQRPRFRREERPSGSQTYAQLADSRLHHSSLNDVYARPTQGSTGYSCTAVGIPRPLMNSYVTV